MKNCNETTPLVGEIILYQPNNSIRLEVMIEDETVWLTQSQMVVLFDSSKANISEHIKHVYETRELEEVTTVRKFRTVRTEGDRLINRILVHYCLDMIIAVGYRVNTKRGTQFRIWANRVLKEYLLKGYAINYRIERVESFAIIAEQRLTETDKKIEFLTQYIESVLADYNDINENTRMQLDIICKELAELQIKNKWIDKPRKPIGFLQSKND